MKIRQLLNEAGGITAAFAFGRFNPAHQGHIAVWQTVEKSGVKWYIGTNPSTVGPNDPLTFEQKSSWMEEIYPQIQGHIVPEQSVVTLAVKIFNDLGKNENSTIGYITDETDWAWSGKLLNQYNGVEGKHGYYKFAQIIHIPSPRVSSATALREAARADDKVAFYHASGTDPKSKVAGLSYFDTVKQAVEKYPLPVKRGQKVKEQGVAEDSATKKLSGATPAPAPNPYLKDILMRHIDEVRHFVNTGYIDPTKPMFQELYEYFANEIPDSVRRNPARLERRIGDMIAPHAKFYAYQKLMNGQGVAEGLEKFLPNDVNIAINFNSKDPIAGLGKIWEIVQDGKIRFYLSNGHRDALNKLLSKPIASNEDWNLLKKQMKNVLVRQQGVAEGEAEYGPEWDEMVNRLGQKAKEGPRKTVWDPEKRVYKTVPITPKSKNVDEASLATMRDYFAGDEQARDPYEITKQRLHFDKEANANRIKTKKEFRSEWDYQQWLKQNKLKPMSKPGVNEEELKQNWVQKVMERKK